MPYYYWWDPTYFLVIIGAVICLLASAHVNNTIKKYSKYRSMVRNDRCTGGTENLKCSRHL